MNGRLVSLSLCLLLLAIIVHFSRGTLLLGTNGVGRDKIVVLIQSLACKMASTKDTNGIEDKAGSNLDELLCFVGLFVFVEDLVVAHPNLKQKQGQICSLFHDFQSLTRLSA